MSGTVGTLVTGGLAMVDRIDLFIAVIGIVAAIVGSSAPLWMALSKKPDKDDLARLETRMDAKFEALEARFDDKIDAVETHLGLRIEALDDKIDSVEARLGATLTRVDTKLDALILRLVPEQPQPREFGAGNS
jgi:hypothetical protein